MILAAAFSFKVASDHVKYQDGIIEHETQWLKTEIRNSG